MKTGNTGKFGFRVSQEITGETLPKATEGREQRVKMEAVGRRK